MIPTGTDSPPTAQTDHSSLPSASNEETTNVSNTSTGSCVLNIDSGTTVQGSLPPLFKAIRQRSYDEFINAEVIKLVEAGENINKSVKKNTPLHLAIQHNKNVAVIACLLDSGADVNSTNRKYETALVSAIVLKRSDDVISAIIDACPDVRNSPAAQPLLLTALWYSASDIIINKLIKAGANVNAKDHENRTPLWLALYRERSDDVIKNLISAGADVHSSISSGNLMNYCPLMMAMDCFRSDEIVKMILDAGAFPRLQKFSCKIEPKYYAQFPAQKMMPHVFRTTNISPMITALWGEQPWLVKRFISANFLNSVDMAVPRNIKLALMKHLESSSSEESLNLAHQVLDQPWSLWTLSFVAVSTAVGYQPGRRDRLAGTGLPKSLQRQLMFGKQ